MSEQQKRRYHEAQAGVLGSILLDSRWAGEVIHRTSESHYTGEYRTLFQAIKKLFQKGDPIDPVTVLHAVGNEYRQTILTLMDLTPTATNCSAYIDLALEQSRLIALQALALELAGAPTVEAARELMAKANQTLADRPSARIVTMKDGFLDFCERQDRKPDLIPWGFDRLDDSLRAEAGDMIVLGGYPSAGKTAFSLQLALAQAKARKVGYFSLETKPEKLIDRAVTTVCRLNFDHVKSHALTREEWDICNVKANAFAESQLEVIQAGSLSVMDIQAITLSRGYQVIYVDYLQLVAPEDRRRSEVEQVSQISRDLHTLATATGVMVCALSQLSRPEKAGTIEKAPGLHSLRQSGQIEQDADGVMLLYKEEPDEPRSRRCLKLAKNKEGPSSFVIMLDFHGENQRFSLSYGGPPKALAKPKEMEDCQVKLHELPMSEEVPF